MTILCGLCSNLIGLVSLYEEKIKTQTDRQEGPCEDAGEDSHLQAKERDFRRNQLG